MKGLIEGRIVHYIPEADDLCLPTDPDHHYAGIVTLVLDMTAEAEVNICIFSRKDNAHEARIAKFSNQRLPGTWHWPERV